MFNIVLVEPEIPSNTGNIARTCAVTGSSLHLIKPLGFSLDDKYLKRAGLDYWNMLNVRVYDNLESFFEENKDATCYFSTTKGSKNYTKKSYKKGDYFIFGKETKGLPVDLLDAYPDNCIKIPMLHNDKARSLNLANSVAVVVYEALRQVNFDI